MCSRWFTMRDSATRKSALDGISNSYATCFGTLLDLVLRFVVHEMLNMEPRVPEKEQTPCLPLEESYIYCISTVEGSSLLHMSQVCIPLYCCTSLCRYCVLRILHASEAIRKAKMALRFAHTNRTNKQADMNVPFVAFLAIKTHHRSTTSGGAHHSLATSFRTPFYMTLYRPFLRHFSSHHVVRSTLWSLHPLKRAQLVKGRRSARDPGTSTRDGH